MKKGMAYEVVHYQGTRNNSFTLSGAGEALAGEEYCSVLKIVVQERYKIVRDPLKDNIRINQNIK